MNNFRIFYFLIGIALFSGVVKADVIKPGSMYAVSDGINVSIRWMSENENNVISYELLRSTSPNSGFSPIGVVTAEGASSYEFIDNTAFKKVTTLYYYRIKIKYPGGESFFPALNEPPVTVDHNVSGVRRTWGSIKALFR